MNRLSNALKLFILGFLSKHLSNRIKRTIFLASFWARVKDDEQIHPAMLKKLNDVMVLSNTEEALMVPVQLSRVIWNGRTSTEICRTDVLEKVLSEDQIRSAASSVNLTMPTWLKYAEKDKIESDIKTLLGHRSLVF